MYVQYVPRTVYLILNLLRRYVYSRNYITSSAIFERTNSPCDVDFLWSARLSRPTKTHGRILWGRFFPGAIKSCKYSSC